MCGRGDGVQRQLVDLVNFSPDVVSLDLRQVVSEVAFANYASGSRLVVSQLLLIQQESHAGGAYADRYGSRFNIEFLFRNLRGHVLAPSFFRLVLVRRVLCP